MTNNNNNKKQGFWENLLGPSKDDVWLELSTQINAKIESGGFFGIDKMVLEVENWTITLDTYVVSSGKTTSYFTRMRAPFMAQSGFQFCITNHNIFANLAIKLFGQQDIQIHDAAFDKKFVIEGNSESKVRELLSSEKVRALLLRQEDDIQFALKDDEGWFGTQFPDGVDELYLCKHGIVTDIAVLRSYFELFAETLKKIRQMGVASPEKPGVKL